MYMFLVLLFASFPLLLLGAVAMFKREAHDEPMADARPGQREAIPARRFFTETAPASRLVSRLPREVLLNQIERHVRLEVAAAESFLDLPTTEALHAETSSPLLN